MGVKNESAVDYWLSEEGLMLISCWMRDGCTQEELCDKMGIGYQTLRNWRKRYPEIEYAYQTSKEIIDYKVENALLKAALGFKKKEIKVTLGKVARGGQMYEVLKETTTSEVPPNVMAAITWLNNRRFDKWKRNRDKIIEIGEEEQSVAITVLRGKTPLLGENVNPTMTFNTQQAKQAEKEYEEAIAELEGDNAELESEMDCSEEDWDDYLDSDE